MLGVVIVVGRRRRVREAIRFFGPMAVSERAAHRTARRATRRTTRRTAQPSACESGTYRSYEPVLASGSWHNGSGTEAGRGGPG